MRRGLAFVLLTAAAAAACSLSLDGFTGPADSAADGGDASTTTPGTPPPAGTTPPGTPPPPPPPSDAGVDPCDGTIFCETFDKGSLDPSWELRLESTTGTVGIDTTASVTAPGSLLAMLGPGHSGEDVYITNHMSAPTTSDIDMELDIRLEGACDGHIADVGIDASPTYLLRLDDDNGTFTLAEDNDPVDGGSVQKDLATGLPVPPVGTWIHVKLRANLATKTGEYWLNGTLVKSAPIAPIAKSGTPHFRTGVISQAAGTGCAVRSDNVAVRAR